MRLPRGIARLLRQLMCLLRAICGSPGRLVEAEHGLRRALECEGLLFSALAQIPVAVGNFNTCVGHRLRTQTHIAHHVHQGFLHAPQRQHERMELITHLIDILVRLITLAHLLRECPRGGNALQQAVRNIFGKRQQPARHRHHHH